MTEQNQLGIDTEFQERLHKLYFDYCNDDFEKIRKGELEAESPLVIASRITATLSLFAYTLLREAQRPVKPLQLQKLKGARND